MKLWLERDYFELPPHVNEAFFQIYFQVSTIETSSIVRLRFGLNHDGSHLFKNLFVIIIWG
jgi:hypothetical protein